MGFVQGSHDRLQHVPDVGADVHDGQPGPVPVCELPGQPGLVRCRRTRAHVTRRERMRWCIANSGHAGDDAG